MKKGAKLPMNTAVAPNDNVHKCIKTAKLKNNESISGVRGRIGYVEQAIKSGDYKNIGYDIKEYRTEHTGCSCLDLYTNLLYVKYRHIFKAHPSKIYNAQNILKVINGDKFWRQCYFFNAKQLIHQAELQLAELMDRETLEDSVIISAYDKINKYEIEKSKLKLEQEKLELLKNGNATTKPNYDGVSQDTLNTIDAILSDINSTDDTDGDSNEAVQ